MGRRPILSLEEILNALPPGDKSYKSSQSERVIRKFGGAMRLTEALAAIGRPKAAFSVYRWTYPRSRGGTGGFIPSHCWPDILQAARIYGIIIEPSDFDPRTKALESSKKSFLERKTATDVAQAGRARAFPDRIRKPK